jgi:hypothetical protein
MKFPMRSLAVMAMAATLTGLHNFDEPRIHFEPKQPETEEEKAKRLGLKKWDFNGIVIFAATKSKAKKLLNKKINNHV